MREENGMGKWIILIIVLAVIAIGLSIGMKALRANKQADGDDLVVASGEPLTSVLEDGSFQGTLNADRIATLQGFVFTGSAGTAISGPSGSVTVVDDFEESPVYTEAADFGSISVDGASSRNPGAYTEVDYTGSIEGVEGSIGGTFKSVGDVYGKEGGLWRSLWNMTDVKLGQVLSCYVYPQGVMQHEGVTIDSFISECVIPCYGDACCVAKYDMSTGDWSVQGNPLWLLVYGGYVTSWGDDECDPKAVLSSVSLDHTDVSSEEVDEEGNPVGSVGDTYVSFADWSGDWVSFVEYDSMYVPLEVPAGAIECFGTDGYAVVFRYSDGRVYKEVYGHGSVDYTLDMGETYECLFDGIYCVGAR